MWSHRVYLFGDRGLIFCLAPTIEGRLFISRVKRQELIDYLLDEMTTTLVATSHEVPSVESQTQPAVACSQCGEILDLKAKFCDSCGAPVSAAEVKPTCPDCGSELKASSRFCPECGRPTDSGNRPG
ncbi:MAG: zinc ribbon domain-containing protein [Dehalococcoidales bacterium]|nr:zinc ribbon domain-containing protein [Dehalococcoidales bacterium]